VQKLLVGGNPLYLKLWIKVTALEKIADFRSIFARSASAVTAVWKLFWTKLHSIHWPNYRCKNNWWGTTSSTWNFESKWPRWSEIWTI